MNEELEDRQGREGDSGNSFERTPFTPPSASELSLKEISDKAERVAVVGEIVSIDKPAMSGRISSDGIECTVSFTEGEQLLGLREGSIVRVIGKPLKQEKLSIEADIVQELKGFDSNLYSKVKELEKKYYGGRE